MSIGELAQQQDSTDTRPLIAHMTDRELLEEIARNQRQASDLIEQFINDMAKNPMMKMFGGKR